MKIRQFVLEYATERAGSLDVLRYLPDDKEIGLGVVNPRTTDIETVDFIRGKVETLLKYRDPDTIFLNPDCGFGTFADRPVNSAEVARSKLAAIGEAARQLRKSGKPA